MTHLRYQSSTTPEYTPQPRTFEESPLHDPKRYIRRSTLRHNISQKQLDDMGCTGDREAQTRTRDGPTTTTIQLLMFPEILLEIFTHLYEQYGFIALPIHRRDFPWNVNAVCSQWRRVVWSMGDICDTIMITGPHGSSYMTHAKMESALHTLTHILSLSAALVSVEVKADFARIPVLHSHRLRELRLDFVNEEILTSLFRVPPGSFDHLEELDLIFQDTREDIWLVFPPWSAQVMPVLQALYVDSTPYERYILRPMFFLPWVRLTEIEIADAMSPRNILDILRQSQYLVRGTLRVYDEGVVDESYPITLPHLVFLSLIYETVVDMTHFLGSLILPALEEFHICCENMGEGFTWSHQPFTSLINRSHCGIKQFTFEPTSVATTSLLEDSAESFLQALPVVKTLKLHVIIPASTFVAIQQSKLLLQVESIALILRGDGVEDFLSHWVSIPSCEKAV
ncbi:hypothetical protein BDZ94DRAFT_1316094 [Collybia nuda]|uniref:F-box domain-containing protein n=1 Tax=Collybia nuda TaxID=64659 RepID=A0A9P6CC11_9AGAR|nr:hypothetical protein BDZ94DRAFT_1316094 [Collybia nuda]